jgi:hypothetical protein
MTKQDYIKLSTAIKSHTSLIKEKDDSQQLIRKDDFIMDLCDILLEDNPRFDIQKFIEACYK